MEKTLDIAYGKDSNDFLTNAPLYTPARFEYIKNNLDKMCGNQFPDIICFQEVSSCIENKEIQGYKSYFSQININSNTNHSIITYIAEKLVTYVVTDFDINRAKIVHLAIPGNNETDNSISNNLIIYNCKLSPNSKKNMNTILNIFSNLFMYKKNMEILLNYYKIKNIKLNCSFLLSGDFNHNKRTLINYWNSDYYSFNYDNSIMDFINISVINKGMPNFKKSTVKDHIIMFDTPYNFDIPIISQAIEKSTYIVKNNNFYTFFNYLVKKIANLSEDYQYDFSKQPLPESYHHPSLPPFSHQHGSHTQPPILVYTILASTTPPILAITTTLASTTPPTLATTTTLASTTPPTLVTATTLASTTTLATATLATDTTPRLVLPTVSIFTIS